MGVRGLPADKSVGTTAEFVAAEEYNELFVELEKAKEERQHVNKKLEEEIAISSQRMNEAVKQVAELRDAVEASQYQQRLAEEQNEQFAARLEDKEADLKRL